jgi:hypothetical protein
MKKSLLITVFLMVLLFNAGMLKAQNVHYLSPLPDSRYNMESTSIIIGYDHHVNDKGLHLKVYGSLSGYHNGKLSYVQDYHKIVFEPYVPFRLGEKVTVSGFRDENSFSFYVREGVPGNLKDLLTQRLNIETGSVKPVPVTTQESPLFLDTLPQFVIQNYGETYDGEIFMINFATNLNIPCYLMILRNNGTPKFSRRLKYRGFDFKKQNNYYLYFDEQYGYYRALDTANYVVTDSFFVGNGYITDFHECILEPDNSAWLLSYDPQYVDMSQIVPGGNPYAIVTGLIVQKINPEKLVVFQWRSWDHFQITDATHEDLLAAQIDYVHGNSIGIDKDNNIIISSRHMDEITKINSETGEIIWRMGGKHNMFDFGTDTAKFSHQHDARRLANNHLMLYDNGNFHYPPRTRVVEYEVDEDLFKLVKAWEYKRTPAVYAFAMGNAQRLPNGNTIIGWGSYTKTATEVGPSGNLLYDISLPSNQWSYRVYRYETDGALTNTGENNYVNSFELSQNYPNPFNPVTKIDYSVAKAVNVNITVYNMLGQEVKTLVNRFMPAGKYSVNFNGNNLNSGIYFYKITAGEFTNVKKMTLIK